MTPYAGSNLSGTVGTAETINFTVIEPVQLPFIDQTVQDGTTILVEEFDTGGQGVAYFDTSRAIPASTAITLVETKTLISMVAVSLSARGRWGMAGVHSRCGSGRVRH